MNKKRGESPRICRGCNEVYTPKLGDRKGWFCYKPECREKRHQHALKISRIRKAAWLKKKTESRKVPKKGKKRCDYCHNFHNGPFNLCHNCIEYRRQHTDTSWMMYG